MFAEQSALLEKRNLALGGGAGLLYHCMHLGTASQPVTAPIGQSEDTQKLCRSHAYGLRNTSRLQSFTSNQRQPSWPGGVCPSSGWLASPHGSQNERPNTNSNEGMRQAEAFHGAGCEPGRLPMLSHRYWCWLIIKRAYHWSPVI